MTSTESMPNIRNNPAPHRGFNAKARELLLDPPEHPINRYGLDRTGSDDEFRRKLNGLRLIRTDSEATNASQKSHSSTQSYPEQATGDFDVLDDLPTSKKRNPTTHKFIGDIGRAQSAGDLFKKKTVIHTFKQQNIMKLPSVESDIGCGSLPRSNSSSSIADGAQDRQSQYALK